MTTMTSMIVLKTMKKKRGMPRGTWRIEWMKRLREEEKKPKPKVKGFK